MVAIGYIPSKILQLLQNRKKEEVTLMYLLFEQWEHQEPDGPIQHHPMQPAVTPCWLPTGFSTCPNLLRRRASMPAFLGFFFLKCEFNLFGDDGQLSKEEWHKSLPALLNL
jgi:hypothetical protein